MPYFRGKHKHKPSGYSTAITAAIDASVYGEGYTSTENFSLYYSFNGSTWYVLRNLPDSEKGVVWAHLYGSVDMGSNISLYIRVGGQTLAGGSAWLGYIDRVNVNFTATRSGGTIHTVGTNLSDDINDRSQFFADAGDVTPWTILGSTHTSGIFSDSGYNYIEYRFDRNPATQTNNFCYVEGGKNHWVSNCKFDSTTDGGLPSMFAQMTFNLCIDVSYINSRFHNSLGNCTGMDTMLTTSLQTTAILGSACRLRHATAECITTTLVAITLLHQSMAIRSALM